MNSRISSSFLLALTLAHCTTLISSASNGTRTANLVQQCCAPDREILKGKCEDGNLVQLRNCTFKYIVEPEYTDFEFDTDGNLVYDNVTMEMINRDNFCVAKRGGKPVVIACLDEDIEPDDPSTMRAVCELVSVVFLILTVLVYIIVPILQDLQGKCIIHFLYNLAISFLFLAIVQQAQTEEQTVCEFFAFAIYYFFLNSFFWLNVISIHIWKITVYPTSLGTDKQWYAIYCIYAYSVPSCFLLACIVGHYTPGDHVKPHFGETSCWFTGFQETWLYFYGPISILLIINILLFVWSSVKLWTTTTDIHATKLRSKRYRFLLCIKLFFIMGLLWVFEILSYAIGNTQKVTFWTITDYVNALQGVLIFLLLVVFRKRALRGLAHSSLMCFQMPTSWKTLVDEECEEDEEENHITNSKDADIER